MCCIPQITEVGSMNMFFKVVYYTCCCYYCCGGYYCCRPAAVSSAAAATGAYAEAACRSEVNLGMPSQWSYCPGNCGQAWFAPALP